jgi:hypothetical protein
LLPGFGFLTPRIGQRATAGDEMAVWEFGAVLAARWGRSAVFLVFRLTSSPFLDGPAICATQYQVVRSGAGWAAPAPFAPFLKGAVQGRRRKARRERREGSGGGEGRQQRQRQWPVAGCQ